ncbi:alpha/beta hydrolase [Massilia niabensis]|uniref:Alpha/beta hydrolase n=1 Tax=Massilia niabensis TaxID=544910 RepID=A0ABW0L4J2_9BURK
MRRLNHPLLRALVTSVAALAIASPLGALAQPAGTSAGTPIAVPTTPAAIRLYPGVAPGSEGATQVEQWTQFADGRRARNITVPVLIPVLPAAGKANGTAVIVAPGGAFRLLSMDNEGHAVADWLAQRGVSAFILKYRVVETPAKEEDFIRERRRGVASGGRLETFPLAVDDGRRAVQLVRENASRWGLNGGRIGMIGFSAGAMTTLEVVSSPNAVNRPDFAALIYGPIEARPVAADAPPLFIGLAADDPLIPHGDFGLVSSWKKAGRPVELHFYERGAHGFGMKKLGFTSDIWPEQFWAWMRMRGLVGQ